jgi:hypothetical protein
VAWADPAKESWRRGDLGRAELHLPLVTDGERVEFATVPDIDRARLSASVVKQWAANGWWLERLAEFNAGCGGRAVPNPPPASGQDAAR